MKTKAQYNFGTRPACDCGSKLPYGKAHTPERYAHNITPEHRLAVLRQTGAPAHIIAKAEAQLAEAH